VGAGDAVDVLGPLGRGFWVPPQTELAVLVGGGVGIPPMLYLAAELARRGVRAVAFVGATSGRLLPLTVAGAVEVSPAGEPTLCAAELAEHGCPTAITTDDGSLGLGALVTDALWPWVDREAPAKTVIYTCGPEPMMRAAAQGAAERDLACQAAMERQMACGMGACQSCVCRARTPEAPGWAYRLVCQDGPVFDAAELIWDDPHAGHARREEHGKDR
jgi:dihydroorotate dehydrogenase electron transfer subunit